jgi:uncharacterized protein YjcR
MASAHKRVNWPDLRAEYVSGQSTTIHALAKKYGVKPKTVEWHSLHKGWMNERKAHAEKVREKLGNQTASSAAAALAAIHRQHLTARRPRPSLSEHV